MSTVERSMTRQVFDCGPHDSLLEAAHIMWDKDCGFVPVVTPDHTLVGVLTDRDICMAACTQGRPLSEVHVADVMATSVHACRESDDVGSAHQAMREFQVRRLPVIDDQQRLLGVVSINDLSLQACEDDDEAAQAAVARTLAEVGKHRLPMLAGSEG